MTRAEEIAQQIVGPRTCYLVNGLGNMCRTHGELCAEFAAALESYAAEKVKEDRERCAKIADAWAKSHSCNPDGPCDHIRTGAAIAARIREAGEPVPVQSQPKNRTCHE